MTPTETLRKAADEFRDAARDVDHTNHGGLRDCKKCDWLRLADDCDLAASELEREP